MNIVYVAYFALSNVRFTAFFLINIGNVAFLFIPYGHVHMRPKSCYREALLRKRPVDPCHDQPAALLIYVAYFNKPLYPTFESPHNQLSLSISDL